MPVADLIRLGFAPELTAQQIADMALSADQERRRAEKRGNAISASVYAEEMRKLAQLSNRDAY